MAALLATRPDHYRDPADDLAGTVSASPDRLILLYPVILASGPFAHASITRLLGPDASEAARLDISPEKHVSEVVPPTLLFHAADDEVVNVANSIEFAKACWTAGVSAELHVFPHGGHGRSFSYDPAISPKWREIVHAWLRDWTCQEDRAK